MLSVVVGGTDIVTKVVGVVVGAIVMILSVLVLAISLSAGVSTLTAWILLVLVAAGKSAITVPLPVEATVISKVVPLLRLAWVMLTTLRLGAVPLSNISLAVNIFGSIG